MRVAVAGGTGQVGRPVITALKANGHEAIPLSRSSGVDLMTGAGLAPALEGVASVVDVTNTTATERADTEHFFGTVSATLLNAEQQAGIGHHVVLSIAGVDRIKGNGHYFGKRREEQVVRDGPVPWTIQRAAQFFEFAAMMVSWTAHDGTAVIPPLLMQPVAAEDVGKVLAVAGHGARPGRTAAGRPCGHGAAGAHRARRHHPAAAELAQRADRRGGSGRAAAARRRRSHGRDKLRRLAGRRPRPSLDGRRPLPTAALSRALPRPPAAGCRGIRPRRPPG
jgi:hypothetical protein